MFMCLFGSLKEVAGDPAEHGPERGGGPFLRGEKKPPPLQDVWGREKRDPHTGSPQEPS